MRWYWWYINKLWPTFRHGELGVALKVARREMVQEGLQKMPSLIGGRDEREKLSESIRKETSLVAVELHQTVQHIWTKAGRGSEHRREENRVSYHLVSRKVPKLFQLRALVLWMKVAIAAGESSRTPSSIRYWTPWGEEEREEAERRSYTLPQELTS